MIHRTNGWMLLVAILVLIGLFSGIATNPVGVLIPLIIFGAIVYLYKFPPKWLIKWTAPQSYTKTYNTKRTYKKKTAFNKPHKIRRRHVTLTVIAGKKKGPFSQRINDEKRRNGNI